MSWAELLHAHVLMCICAKLLVCVFAREVMASPRSSSSIDALERDERTVLFPRDAQTSRRRDGVDKCFLWTNLLTGVAFIVLGAVIVFVSSSTLSSWYKDAYLTGGLAEFIFGTSPDTTGPTVREVPGCVFSPEKNRRRHELPAVYGSHSAVPPLGYVCVLFIRCHYSKWSTYRWREQGNCTHRSLVCVPLVGVCVWRECLFFRGLLSRLMVVPALQQQYVQSAS